MTVTAISVAGKSSDWRASIEKGVSPDFPSTIPKYNGDFPTFLTIS